MLSLFRLLAVIMPLVVSAASAEATTTASLKDLVNRGTALRSTLSVISISSGSTCSQLGTLNSSIEDFIIVIQGVSSQLSSPLALTVDDLTSLNDLSYIAHDMASEAPRISQEIRSIDELAELFEYRASLSAMLRLSDNIGTMSNRILEMADRILVMSNNIGTMADRILETQRIQNTNIALAQQSILTTQQNMIAMSKSLSTIGYNLSLGLLLNDTKLQVSEMQLIKLDSTNAVAKLGYLEAKTALLTARTLALYDLMMKDSQKASNNIDGDTLTYFMDISAAQKQFSAILETYAATVQQIAPLMQLPVLSDATRSMLRLTADINTMSKRIVEMGDKIIVMADNIGLMSNRIVETQKIQRENVALTLNSTQTAQNTMLALIKNSLGQ